MKHLTLILFACLLGFSCFAEVTIDKENCTITKDGKTFPLYGEVQIVEFGTADLTVKVIETGSCDLEVKKVQWGSATSCGEWKIISFGKGDFTVRLVEWGSADLEIKFIQWGKSGFY